MILTLIKTLTADDDASLTFHNGVSSVVFDSTYDEYMFVFTDIGPATDTADFTFQVNAAGASGFNETMTTTSFIAHGYESGSGSSINYQTAEDQAQGTAYQVLGDEIGNGSDESLAGILHIFTPANTTYVTNFYSRCTFYGADDSAKDEFCAGYVNITEAVDEIQFKMDSGNFDVVIQLFGVA